MALVFHDLEEKAWSIISKDYQLLAKAIPSLN